ncbi:hypothetical protein KDA06_00470 [Candidatus Saccharibacteria bacterium]|jgi:hypothetical protein|nr:hypothetical protein [Candidatus Saccharibacteria bacterium]HPR09121.1 hypothetical protein [Candidatus Saccharibacteria bacterium]
MKQILKIAALSILLVFAVIAPAIAAPNRSRPAIAPLGLDVSYPQCKKSLPSTQAFGVVGVNGGKASNSNPCLSKQLQWASKSLGSKTQTKVQLYVNTASPGDYIDLVASWPADNEYHGQTTTIPAQYGTCLPNPATGKGENSAACAWQYGWERAFDDVNTFFALEVKKAITAGASLAADPGAYAWWLDVETMNSWQTDVATDTQAYQKNAAALEGMVAYFTQAGVTQIGLYSTNYQWNSIVGNTITPQSPLFGLDTWYALDQTTVDVARRACSDPQLARPLTDTGIITMTQFISNNLDHNVSCADIVPPTPSV